MGQDRNVPVFERPENPVRDLLAWLLLAIMHAGDDPVGLGEYIVRQIHAPFFENIAFDALQNRKAVEFSVQVIDLAPLLAKSVGVKPIGHAGAGRVVSNGDVLETSL